MTDAVLPTSTLRTARRRSPFRRKAFPYLLVAPAVLYLLAITLYPGIFALWRSFYHGRFKLEFVGFQNYVDLFRDETFWHSLTNTLIIGGITLAVEFVIAMTLAALVYRDPLGARLAHPVPAAHAVHALGRGLSLEAAVQRRPGHQRPPDADRPRRPQHRLHGLHLACPRRAGGDRRLAVGAVPVHHLRRGPAGPGQGDRGGGPAGRRALAARSSSRSRCR